MPFGGSLFEYRRERRAGSASKITMTTKQPLTMDQ